MKCKMEYDICLGIYSPLRNIIQTIGYLSKIGTFITENNKAEAHLVYICMCMLCNVVSYDYVVIYNIRCVIHCDLQVMYKVNIF